MRVNVHRRALVATSLIATASCTSSGSATTDACTAANAESIQASSYDQSCKSTSDCVAVGVGNACLPCEIECPSVAINVGAMAKYMSDVEKTWAWAQIQKPSFVPCGCPEWSSPCCVAGSCQMDCAMITEAADASATDDSGDVGVDAAPASPPACSQSLAVGCTPYQPVMGDAVDFSNCPPTWNDAVAFCVMYAGDFGYAETDCGAYRRWHVENVDVGCSYYYDSTSGDLVAVFCAGPAGTTCLGGPTGFVEPACPTIEYTPCAAIDAGQ
jgi:hypothetical protein